MTMDQSYIPEYDSLKELLVQMASEPSVNHLLQMAADGMTRRPHVALTRVWLVQPGDECDCCKQRSTCLDQTKCLHLSVSSGHDNTIAQAVWQNISPEKDLHHRRIPITSRDIGSVVLSSKPFRKDGIHRDPNWRSRNPWADDLGFLSISVHPLVHVDVVMGAIAVYPKIELGRLMEGHFWIHMVANLAGYTIANARAFEQIRHLKAQVELENAYLREEISQVQAFGDIIGSSPPLLNVLSQVELVAPTDATVLILGESGTGKELIAREIHKRSQRAGQPMIRVNCAAIHGELYESEFFGHVKGAFTGALNNRPGRFQAADGGTLFLDEIAEIPLNLQSKLLRVIQEGTYERIGEDQTRRVDVRIIAATNRDIKAEVAARRFREDLYYRLNVFPIEIAPLRRRKSDIAQLAEHFLKHASRKMARPTPALKAADLKKLAHYDWPGNVRELQSTIERTVILSRKGRLHFDLPNQLGSTLNDCSPDRTEEKCDGGEIIGETGLNRIIRTNIVKALMRCNWKIYGNDGAAELLGIKPTTLASRMKRFGIIRPRP